MSGQRTRTPFLPPLVPGRVARALPDAAHAHGVAARPRLPRRLPRRRPADRAQLGDQRRRSVAAGDRSGRDARGPALRRSRVLRLPLPHRRAHRVALAEHRARSRLSPRRAGGCCAGRRPSCCSQRAGSRSSRARASCSSTRSPRSRARRRCCSTRSSTACFGSSVTCSTSRRPRASPPTTSRTSRRAASSSAQPLVYGLQLFVLGMALTMVGLSWLEPRLWCRHLCPLGALLGLSGRFAVLGRVVDAEKCIACGRCEKVCPLDADPRRLPRHRHVALPARARVRRRLPHRRDLVRPRPATLGCTGLLGGLHSRGQRSLSQPASSLTRDSPAPSATPG